MIDGDSVPALRIIFWIAFMIGLGIGLGIGVIL